MHARRRRVRSGFALMVVHLGMAAAWTNATHATAGAQHADGAERRCGKEMTARQDCCARHARVPIPRFAPACCTPHANIGLAVCVYGPRVRGTRESRRG